jgi:hypothetical protein
MLVGFCNLLVHLAYGLLRPDESKPRLDPRILKRATKNPAAVLSASFPAAITPPSSAARSFC